MGVKNTNKGRESKTEDEINREKAELEKDFNDKLSTLKDFLNSLESWEMDRFLLKKIDDYH